MSDPMMLRELADRIEFGRGTWTFVEICNALRSAADQIERPTDEPQAPYHAPSEFDLEALSATKSYSNDPRLEHAPVTLKGIVAGSTEVRTVNIGSGLELHDFRRFGEDELD